LTSRAYRIQHLKPDDVALMEALLLHFDIAVEGAPRAGER
jgi:hypothetical protein